eukprot:612540-Hanusia_phi.AAC.1
MSVTLVARWFSSILKTEIIADTQMPAKKGNYRGRGTFRHAGSKFGHSMLASPDDPRSLTEHQ